MDGQEDFFSENHNRLLNIAWWAKNMAWLVLLAYVLWVGIQVIRLVLAKDDGNFFGPTLQSLATMLRDSPLDAFEGMINITTTPLKGLVYFVVLKGISLGLNMMVETDVNYREGKRGEMSQ
jgi:hypothetical protein